MSFPNKCMLLVLLLVWPLAMTNASDEAHWKVGGSNPLENLRLSKQLHLLFPAEGRQAFEPYEIEDAALVLVSHLQAKGFLDAHVQARVFEDEASEGRVFEWDSGLDTYLPNGLFASRVEFTLQPGLRFYYKDLQVEGDAVLDSETVATFFFEEPFFLQGERGRIFTESGFNAGMSNLHSQLQVLGYQQAHVRALDVQRDFDTGAVRARIEVDAGPVFRVAAIDLEGAESVLKDVNLSRYLGERYSRIVMQDMQSEVRRALYQAGYPDAVVHSRYEAVPQSSDEVEVHLVLEVNPGRLYRVSEVDIQGLQKTREAWLRYRLGLEAGDLLNPLEVEQARLKMSRRGVFDSVQVSTEPSGEDTRKVVFKTRERFPWTWDAFVGWGSYERLRGGMSLEKINVFGLGHRIRLKGLVSMKSALAELRYQIPEFLGESTSVSANTFALFREELSFDREEFGVEVTASKRLRQLDLNLDAVYTFQSLNALGNNLKDAEDTDSSVRVGSVEVRFGRDERDSVLNPTDGYRFYGRVENASDWLGGETDYIRAEFGYSRHGSLSRGLLWHASISHGLVGTVSEPESQIPPNKHFFPGGENSVRGYQKGGAAPKDADGKFLGANSYLLLNLELEQQLSDAFSVVLFFDGVGVSADTAHYPLDETLGSVGLGLRYQTFMGPLRLEYGHNLVSRIGDPDGTLHLSLGFPF